MPALGDVTRRILGVNKPAGDDHDDDDSAYDDPNTESLKSRPRSARPLTAPVSGDHLVTTGVEHHVVTSESPPTRLAGISQLSKSPVRNLFPSSSSDPLISFEFVTFSAFLPNRPLTFRTWSLSNSNMTHSRVGFGRMVERHVRVKAFARAHLSSASSGGNVPRAIVFPAHCV